MAKLIIIADDFTGALDTGVQLSKKGISTQVFVHKTLDWHALDSNGEVLVVDTDSRHLDERQAYRRVFDICIEAKTRGFKYFYKKTDSTLRGNIGAELSALMDACKLDRLPFIPAYPETGRTTKKGYQYVNGVLLDQTVFAADPLEPIKDAYIPNIIRRQSDKIVNLINESHITMGGLSSNEKGILVLGAVDKKDMERIFHLLVKQKDLTALAGCAGFAEYLFKLYSLKTKPRKKKAVHKPILVVSGSVNDMSIKQVQYAEKAGIGSRKILPWELMDDSYPTSLDYKSHIEAAIEGIKDNGYFILKTADKRGDIIPLKGEIEGFSKDNLYKNISGPIGHLVKEILKRVKVGTLVVFGGDTALGIIHELGCTYQAPIRAYAWNSLSTIGSSEFNGFLITKAGGFW